MAKETKRKKSGRIKKKKGSGAYRGFDFGNPVANQVQHPGMWNLGNANLELHRQLDEFQRTFEKQKKEVGEKILKKAEEETKVAVKAASGRKMETALKQQKLFNDTIEEYAKDKTKLLNENQRLTETISNQEKGFKHHLDSIHEKHELDKQTLLERGKRQFEVEAGKNFELETSLADAKKEAYAANQLNKAYEDKQQALEASIEGHMNEREKLYQHNVSLEYALQEKNDNLLTMTENQHRQSLLVKEQSENIEHLRNRLLDSNLLISQLSEKPYEYGNKKRKILDDTEMMTD